MINNLIRFWHGFLVIEIRGNALERFINQIIDKDIELWDLKRIKKDYYQAKIYFDDFNSLRPLVKKRMCWVKVLDKKGLPFIFYQGRKRYFLLLGLIVFLLIFYLGSSLFWFIRIDGLKRIPEERIRTILIDSAIRPGIFKRKINIIELEKKLLQLEPSIAWVGIKWKGTQLYIKIVEKKLVEKAKSGNIVASKNGIITKLIVLKGQAVVKEGNTVRAGQPMIISLKDKEGRRETARGIVKADVWYEGLGESSLDLKKIKFTGKNKVVWGIKFGKRIFWLWTHHSPFNNYKIKREIKRVSKWRNINFSIELIKDEYKELEYLREKRSKDLALFIAKERAMTEILAKFSSETIIKDLRTEQIELLNDNLIKVRILVRAEEDIAKLQDYK